MMDAQEAHEAVQAGVARYLTWKRQFMLDWQSGIQKGNAATLFATIPPQLKEAMKTTSPEQYDTIQRSFAAK